jgi:hypothetical protein
MTLDAVQVPCPDCQLSSPPTSLGLGYWECPGCRRSFFLRRCRACRAVSHVGAQHSWHQRWQCVWCEHRNFGFSRLGDPAAATVADLVADIGGRSLTLAPGDADRQTQPIPTMAGLQAAVADPSGAPLAEAGTAAPLAEAGTAAPLPPPAPLAAASPPVPPTVPLPAAPSVPQTAPLMAVDAAPSAEPVAVPTPRRWWRGRRSAVLAAAVVLILMAAPAVVLASHASHMSHPGLAGPHRPRTSQQISVSASAVRTVYLQGVPGKLTVVGGSGGTVRLTGKLRWSGRPARQRTALDRAAHLLRLSAQCAAASPCTENYRLVVPARTAVVLSQPSGQVLLDSLAGPLRLTAANVNVTATGLRVPSLTAVITSGQLTASFASPPGQISLTLTSAHAIINLPASVRYSVRTQVTSGSVQAGVPQAAHSGHLVTARLDSSDLQLQPS